MATHTFDIGLTDGTIKVTDYYIGSQCDTTFVTLTDSGNLNNVSLVSFGNGTATEPGESPGGDDQVYADLSSFNDDFNLSFQSVDSGDTIHITNAIMNGPDAYTVVGTVYTINYIGSDGLQHTVVIDVASTNGTGDADIVITCFAKGTLIETYHGPSVVEDLAVGDRILCGDGRHRIIQWISQRHVGPAEMRRHEEYRPIRIREGALGSGLVKSNI